MYSKTRSVYFRLLAYARPYVKRLLAALCCMLIASGCMVVAPWLLKNIVDDVLISKNPTVLNLLAVGLVVLYLFKNVAYYGQQYLMNWVGQRVVLDIRLRLYDHMQRMSLKYLYGQRVGELLSRITNDVMILQDMITGVLIDVVVQSLSFIGMVGFLLYINWRLTLITFAVLPVAGFVIDRTSKRLRKVGHDIQRQLAGLSAIANEALSAIRIVRSFATEEQEYKRFQSQSGAHFSALMRGVQTNAALMGAVEIILIVALSIILWFGGRIVIRGGMSPGDLVAFLGYLALLVQPVRVFSRVVARMQQGLAAGDRIFEILDTKNEVVTPEDPVFLKPIRGDIAFRNVSFSYIEGNPVLSDIDLNIRPGEKVAIVGPTGAGKTTLADLVTRLYDPDCGKVSIDGVNVKDIDLPTLRKQTGIVPQDPVLLKGSIAFNISYGCESATEESIREAARIAGIHTFIESLAEGYETEVGERGITLSGGQRQRMAIARAVVRDPRIIILDEATSSLDAAVEQEVQDAMRKAMKGRTSIVIAHRLATVREADRIIVLENGRIAEEGAHEQLKSAGGLYSRLCELQFGNGNGTSS